VAGALLAAFLAFLTTYRLRGGRELACGCFADFEQKTSTALLIGRNMALAAAWAVAWAAREAATPAVTALDGLFAAAGLVGLVVLWSTTTHLVRTVRAWLAYAKEGEA